MPLHCRPNFLAGDLDCKICERVPKYGSRLLPVPDAVDGAPVSPN